MKRFDAFNEISIGDLIYTGCMSGLGSGGAIYDNGDKVLKITKTKIITENGSFSRKTGNAISPPFAYYISYWRKQ